MSPVHKRIQLSILILAIVIRIVLTLFNTEANDDHIQPITLWIESGEYPNVHDCWECFQPRAFYGLIKNISETLGFNDPDSIRKVFQSVNLIISLLILLLIFKLHTGLKLPSSLKLALFAFWSFNPKLIAIGAQATNDLIVVLAGMLFCIFTERLLSGSRRNFYLFNVFLITLFSGLVKGSGLIIALSAIVAFSYFLVKSESKATKLLSGLFIIILPILIAHWGGYYQKYQDYGNAFIINQDKAPKANWIEEDSLFKGRKGLSTISETFFSFRLGSLMKQPYNLNESSNYPPHRESFFTQFYGQFSNALFERHPPGWISINPDMMNIARINYLLILTLFIVFLFALIFSLFKGGYRFVKTSLVKTYFFHALFITATLAFILKYSLDYRDFSNMKFIFLLPTLHSMEYIFALACNRIRSMHKSVFVILTVLLLLVSLGYLVNLVYLTGLVIQ